MAAFDVVGVDLKLRLGVDLGARRQQERLVELMPVGLLGLWADQGLALEDTARRVVDNALEDHPRRGAGAGVVDEDCVVDNGVAGRHVGAAKAAFGARRRQAHPCLVAHQAAAEGQDEAVVAGRLAKAERRRRDVEGVLSLVDQLAMVEHGAVFQDHLHDAVGERRRALLANVALDHRRPAAAPGDQQVARLEHGWRRGGGHEYQMKRLLEPGAVGQLNRGAVTPKGRVEGGQRHAVEVEYPAHVLGHPPGRGGWRAQGNDFDPVARQVVVRQLGAKPPVDEDQPVVVGQTGDAPIGD